jgi:hypothetical protein
MGAAFRWVLSEANSRNRTILILVHREGHEFHSCRLNWTSVAGFQSAEVRREPERIVLGHAF